MSIIHAIAYAAAVQHLHNQCRYRAFVENGEVVWRDETLEECKSRLATEEAHRLHNLAAECAERAAMWDMPDA